VIKPALNEEARAELGRRRLDVVRVIDLAPTLLEMLGEDPLPGAEGTSLLHAADRLTLAEVHPPQSPSTIVALRDAHYKLIYTAGEDRFEMFDVKSDTLEMDNVFALQGERHTLPISAWVWFVSRPSHRSAQPFDRTSPARELAPEKQSVSWLACARRFPSRSHDDYGLLPGLQRRLLD
jgi:hypothetical protein